MYTPQNDDLQRRKQMENLLSSLSYKKNQIIKKYRKKFEELKINQIKKSFIDNQK